MSENISPETAMSGKVLDCKKHLGSQIGQCCQVREEESPHGSQVARAKGAVSLGPNGNLQGGFEFVALNTKQKITRHNWDVVPTCQTW